MLFIFRDIFKTIKIQIEQSLNLWKVINKSQLLLVLMSTYLISANISYSNSRNLITKMKIDQSFSKLLDFLVRIQVQYKALSIQLNNE